MSLLGHSFELQRCHRSWAVHNGTAPPLSLAKPANGSTELPGSSWMCAHLIVALGNHRGDANDASANVALPALGDHHNDPRQKAGLHSAAMRAAVKPDVNR
jgi:hypothetical protein